MMEKDIALMRYKTYLYFYSFSELPSKVLLASMIHYWHFSESYIIVTNIKPEKFRNLVPSEIIVIQDKEVESEETREISEILVRKWSESTLFANHPATEIHCFRRWMLLKDMYDKGIIDNKELVFSHDWDDLCFLDIGDLLSEAHIKQYQVVDKPLIVSNTPHPITTRLQPSFMLVNRKSILEYNEAIVRLADLFVKNEKRSYFSDMVPWGYLHNMYSLKGKGSSLLWQELIDKEVFFDDNMRVIDSQLTDVYTREFKIPREYSCLEGTDRLSVKYFSSSSDGNVYIHSKGKLTRVWNIHYSGTEAKYIMMQDLQCMLMPFYAYHTELGKYIGRII